MAASTAHIAEVLSGLRASTARLALAQESDAQAAREAQAGARGRGRIALGLPGIDAALGGGLPRGRLVECVGPRGAGRLTLLLGALAAAQASGEWVALIDGADALQAADAAAAGVVLERLLWVRAAEERLALLATDRVLDAGGFALVALYLGGVSRAGAAVGATARSAETLPAGAREPAAPRRAVPRLRLDESALWLRLGRRAERARAALLVVAERPCAGSFAAATIEVSRGGRGHFVGWGAGRYLSGRPLRVAVVRSKLGPIEAQQAEGAAFEATLGGSWQGPRAGTNGSLGGERLEQAPDRRVSDGQDLDGRASVSVSR